MTDLNALKKAYEEMESLFRIGMADDAEIREFRDYLSLHTLYVWAAQPGFHEDYGKALLPMTGTQMPDQEIRKALTELAEVQNIHFAPPLISMTVKDALLETNFTCACINRMVEFLTDMAFVNGDCTPEEADRIEQIRMVNMDVYNTYNLTRRRIMEGSIPPGVYEYDKFNAKFEYAFDESGKPITAEDAKARYGNTESEEVPEQKFISQYRIPNHLFQIDMDAFRKVGVTEIRVHGYSYDKSVEIIGQLYAEKGLREEFSLVAVLYDRDGDVLERSQNQGYGGGSVVTSAVRRRSFFDGYPFHFLFFGNDGSLGNLSKIKITVEN